jgi:ABC-2 type transport system ATP-binding protein
MADTVAVIDHGKIIAQGTPDELKAQTKTASLEEAFLTLTGRAIREEEGGAIERMRMRRRIWGGGARR